MIREKDFIPSLTGIRAICAYFIFFKHLNPFSPIDSPDGFLFVNQFYTFLTFFFVLSGFIICHKFYEISSLRRKQLYNYFVNRVSRVFPVLFILTTITFAFLFLERSESTRELIKTYFLNITLLKGFSSTWYLTGIGPGWSLSVEELFYFLSPFFFMIIRRKSALLKILLGVYAAGALLTLVFSQINFEGFFSNFPFTFYFTFFGRVFEFVCGMYLAMVVKGIYKSPILEKIGRGATNTGLFIIAGCLVLLYGIAQWLNIMQAYEHWSGLIVNNILMPIGITIFFYGLIYHRSITQRFLGSRPIVAVGNSTYSFYLLHTSFALSLTQKYITDNIFLILILMIGYALGFYFTVEQPLAKLLRRKFIRK